MLTHLQMSGQSRSSEWVQLQVTTVHIHVFSYILTALLMKGLLAWMFLCVLMFLFLPVFQTAPQSRSVSVCA